jgi:hypothetical protein
MKLNIRLIKDLNPFASISKRFTFIINNFDCELIKRRMELQKIDIPRHVLQGETIVLQQNDKETLFTTWQKLLDYYIVNVIEPTIEQIPDNKSFQQQLIYLKDAVNKLSIHRFTKTLIETNIHQFAKLLHVKIILKV